jgi:two-component system response regulator NreC
MAKAAEPIPRESPVRILVVDDHAMVRVSVRTLLACNPQWDICGEAENGDESIQKVRELAPDLVILDITMPGMSGIEAAREIRRIAPDTKILLLTIHDDPQLDRLAHEVGADALVLKAEARTSLISEVQRLAGHNSTD